MAIHPPPPSAEPPTIRIAAALIDGGAGRLLLVRKAGSRWFMQAGGKIEPGETPAEALCRELAEEIGLVTEATHLRHLTRVVCPAANEAGHRVDADIFHLRFTGRPVASAEIEEVVWATAAEASRLPLASLTRDHILPLASSLPSPVECHPRVSSL